MRRSASLETDYFNPCSPQGERRSFFITLLTPLIFQSTLPAGGATSPCVFHNLPLQISIHAPRRGSDPLLSSKPPTRRNFNPRSPQGERRNLPAWCASMDDFNPRSPQGERRSVRLSRFRSSIFQSTLPAGGATFYFWRILWRKLHFNPRSPQGERRSVSVRDVQLFLFQSTLPAGGATVQSKHTAMTA